MGLYQDFLAFLCHELRNPLHAISAMVDLIVADQKHLTHRLMKEYRSQLSHKRDLSIDQNGSGSDGNGSQMSGHEKGSGSGNSLFEPLENELRKRSRHHYPLSLSDDAAEKSANSFISGTGTANGNGNSGGKMADEFESGSRREDGGAEKESTSLQSSFGYDPLMSSSPVLSHFVSYLSKQRDYVSTIESQVSLMATIVDDCLDLSKIEAGKIEFECIGFDLHRLAKSIHAALQARAKTKRVNLKIKIDPSLPRKFYSDPTRIKQIMIVTLTYSHIHTTDRAQTSNTIPTHSL